MTWGQALAPDHHPENVRLRDRRGIPEEGLPVPLHAPGHQALLHLPHPRASTSSPPGPRTRSEQIPIADTNSSKNEAGPNCKDWKENYDPAPTRPPPSRRSSSTPTTQGSKGRQMPPRGGQHSRRLRWARCESRHQRARAEEGLGQRRAFLAGRVAAPARLHLQR